MICFTCLKAQTSEEMSTTFQCKSCVGSTSLKIDGNITDKQLKEVLIKIGAERVSRKIKV